MRKIGNIALLVFFALLMLVPLASSDFRGGSISTTENRVLASAPTLRDESGRLSPSTFINSTEEWIKDNVGGRKLASDVWTRAQFTLFNRSTRANDIIGKKQWIYYAPDYVLADYSGDNLLSETALNLYTARVAELDSRLKGRGINVCWMLIPDKKTVYDEYYPAGIAQAETQTRSQQLISRIQSNTAITLIDMLPTLRAHKPDGQLYYARVDDSHWNFHGSYYGSVEVCKAFGIEPVPDDQVSWTEVPTGALFNGAVTVTESYLMPTTGREVEYVNDEVFFDQLPAMRFADSPGSYRWCAMQENNELPRLIYVGDSYSTMMRDYLTPYFSSITMMHISDTASLGKMIALVQPDCILFECVERMLGYVPVMVDDALASLQANP